MQIWKSALSSFLHEHNMPKNSHHSTFHVLRYAHVRYVKYLFMNIQKQENILKISLLFKEIQKLHA